MEGYRKIEELNELQNILLELMKELHDICEENNLVYTLYAGTFLGAVRHQGFIPWDDDIDITMPRDDYEKLLKLIKEKYSDKYDLYCYPDKNYPYPFAKFCKKDSVVIEEFIDKKYSRLGIYVDIFPMDGYPEEGEKRTKLLKEIEKIRTARINAVVTAKIPENKIKRLFYPAKILYLGIYKAIGYKFFLKKEIEKCLEYSIDDCKYITSVISIPERTAISKEKYYDRKKYKFEKYEFYGSSDYDSILTKFFGDYMTLPPEDKRITHHHMDVYLKEKKD